MVAKSGVFPGSPRLAWMLAVAVALMLAGAAARADALSSVDAAGVRALRDQGVKIVDIRRADEWRETGVIEGSLLITAVDANGQLVDGFPAALMAAVDREEPVVIICRSGNRSAAVSRMMTERGGYTHVIDAAGGMRAWIGEGNPVQPCQSC